MDLTFEIGSRSAPKGHAFVYMSSNAGGEVWASYIVILPITVDMAKYLPPFLMGQLGDTHAQDMSAFGFPPAPEMLDDKEAMMALAEARGDDVLFGGSVNTGDIAAMMMVVADAVRQYSELYNDSTGSIEAGDPDTAALTESEDAGFGVSEVMYGLMSDGDRLNELTTLVGKLRFAVDNGDETLIRDAELDIALLSQHFGFDHKTDRIVKHVKRSSEDGRSLSMLYLQRCYHIVQEDYLMLGEVERQIEDIEAQDPLAGV